MNYTVPPLWPTYIGERRTPFFKAHGIKVRRYGENVGENIENPLGTWKEHRANTLGSPKKWKKNLSPSLTPPPPPAKHPIYKFTTSVCDGGFGGWGKGKARCFTGDPWCARVPGGGTTTVLLQCKRFLLALLSRLRLFSLARSLALSPPTVVIAYKTQE